MDLSPSVDSFWIDFTTATGFRGQPSAVETFGDSTALITELVALVAEGRKRATVGLVRDTHPTGPEIPRVGDHWVVVDAEGEPVCINRTVDVRVGPVGSVDDDFAWDEGERDRSRDAWLSDHRDEFRRQADREGWTYTDDEPCVFERFEVIWPRELADSAPNAIDLSSRYVNLGPTGRAAEVPVGAAFWSEIDDRADLAAGRLVMISRSDATWPHWERHPEGEEVVMVLSGRIDLVLDLDDGEHPVALTEHESVLVPTGIWHRAVVHEPARILTITAGRGTEHRPHDRPD